MRCDCDDRGRGLLRTSKAFVNVFDCGERTRKSFDSMFIHRTLAHGGKVKTKKYDCFAENGSSLKV